jgi:hypothetical protein
LAVFTGRRAVAGKPATRSKMLSAVMFALVVIACTSSDVTSLDASFSATAPAPFAIAVLVQAQDRLSALR